MCGAGADAEGSDVVSRCRTRCQRRPGGSDSLIGHPTGGGDDSVDEVKEGYVGAVAFPFTLALS